MITYEMALNTMEIYIYGMDLYYSWLLSFCKSNLIYGFEVTTSGRQPYHPAAQDWLPTEAKQGWAWSVPGWDLLGKVGYCWKRC